MIPNKFNKHGNGVLVETLDGKSMVLGCTHSRFVEAMERYNQGALMQNAFPFLSASEREFLISGLLPEECELLFNKQQ